MREAGDRVARVDVGYFLTGRASAAAGPPLGRLLGGTGGASAGTAASALESVARPSFAFRGGRLISERGAKRVRSFDLDGRSAQAFSVGGSEHYALPRLAPGLREVNVYLGWLGPMSRLVQAAGVLNAAITALPAGERALAALAARAPGSRGGPSAQARAETGSLVAAIAYDAAGGELASVRLVGVNGYTFTGEILAWGAMRAAAEGPSGGGALGPVDGFGLDALTEGVASAGLRVQ
jgi:hypothetical protein